MEIVGRLEQVSFCNNSKPTGKYHPGYTVTQNQRSLKSLARAISFSKDKFSLILLRCNCEDWQQETLEFLHQEQGIETQTLKLPESTENLCNYIELHCENNNPAALIILGLETVTNLDEFLVSLNQTRNEFSHKFSFPLILWVNDEILQKMVRLAPDFHSWAGIPISLT